MSNEKLETTEIPLSPAWKLGRGQEPPKSALIGPWDSTSNNGSNTPGGFPTAQFSKGGPPAGGSFSTRLAHWSNNNGGIQSSLVGNPTSGAAPTNNRWREDERDGKPFSARPGDRWGGTGDDARPGWTGGERTGDRWGNDAAGKGRGDRWSAGTKDRDWAGGPLPGMGDPADLSKKPADRWEGQPGGGDRWRSPGAPGAPSGSGGSFDGGAPATGRGRGFAVGRGRGMRPPYPGTPGVGGPDPQRWALSGVIATGSSATGAGRAYSPPELRHIYDHMMHVSGGHLPVPEGATLPDYTGLIPVAEEGASYDGGHSGEGHHHRPSPFGNANADRASRWVPNEQRTASGNLGAERAGSSAPGSTPPPTVSPQAFAADRWIYRDPQGAIQGPFTKVDILDWFEAGFFPQDLPIKSEVDPPESPFVPLATMLKMWAAIGSGRAPPGFVAGAAAPAQQSTPQPSQPQQQPQQPAEQTPQHQSTGRSLLEALGKQLQDSPGQQGAGGPASPLVSPLDQVLSMAPRPMGPQDSVRPGLGLGMGGMPGLMPGAGGLWGAGAPGGLLGQGSAGGAPGGGLMGSAWQAKPGELGQPEPLIGGGFRPLAGGLLGGPQAPQQPQQAFGQGGMWSGFAPAPAPDGSDTNNGWGVPPSQLPQPSQQQMPVLPPVNVQAPSLATWLQPAAQAAQAAPQQKSLADIQKEQANETLRQAGLMPSAPQPSEAAPAQAPPAKSALEGLHPNLQQLFAAAAAQRNAQQQQQQQHHVAAAAAPPPPPPEPAAERKAKKGARIEEPEPEQAVAQEQPAPAKVAPWAATTAKVPAAKTLREIQEEEAARAAEEAARQAAAASMQEQAAAAPALAPGASAAGAPSPWVRIASANAGAAAPPVPWGGAAAAAAPAAAAAAPRPVNLAAIMGKEAEEAAKARAAAAAGPPAAPVGTGPGPRSTTLGEILDRTLNPAPAAKSSSAWGGVGARPAAVPSLRDVMFEESAADLEGGAVDEDLSDLLPPQPMRPPMPAAPAASTWAPPQPVVKTLKEIQEEEERRARAARAAAAPPPPPPAAKPDDDLFWDYGNASAAPAAPGSAPVVPRQPATTLASIAAKNVPAPAGRAAAVVGAGSSKPAGAWAAAAAPPRTVTAAPAAAPSARANGPAAAASKPAMHAAAQPVASTSAADSGPPLVFGDLVLSSEFRDWCTKEMIKFNGSPDLSLIEFLMTLTSRSEVAEYCGMYMADKPGVSTFVAEFLKRKDAELARASNPKKAAKQAAKQAAAAAPATAASIVAKGGAGKGGAVGGVVPGEDWQQTAAGAKGGKAQGKAGGKGGAAKKGGFAVLGGL